MPVTYMIPRPSPLSYIQWDGTNLDELELFYNGNVALSVVSNDRLKTVSPMGTLTFPLYTWMCIAVNRSVIDSTKNAMLQTVPGPGVEYLTQ